MLNIDNEVLLSLVAILTVVSTITTAIIIPVMRWVAKRWQAVRGVERDLRLAAEAELLEEQKRAAILEVKLQYCESEREGERR